MTRKIERMDTESNFSVKFLSNLLSTARDQGSKLYTLSSVFILSFLLYCTWSLRVDLFG
jgi:hypothetical protein